MRCLTALFGSFLLCIFYCDAFRAISRARYGSLVSLKNQNTPAFTRQQSNSHPLPVVTPWIISHASSPGQRTGVHYQRAGRLFSSADIEEVFTISPLENATSDTISYHSSYNSSLSLVPQTDSVEIEALSKAYQQDWDEIFRKSVNAALLAVSVGAAVYFFVQVDAGITRGWTASEIATRTFVDTWSLYENSLSERPVQTKTAINVVTFLLGDWLSQTVLQKKNALDFDPARVLRAGLIGLGFGPCVHQYYQFSDYILPVEGGIWNRLGKILMDQTVYLTVKCSIYIALVGLLQGDDVQTVKDTVKGRIVGVVTTAWRFWPLVHLVTYSVIPARHRMLWVNMVDLVWNSILAGLSQKKQPEEEEGAQDNLNSISEVDAFVLKQESFPPPSPELFEEAASASNATTV